MPQVLEYMAGGDLLNLLIEKDVFEEDFARFYIAEVSGCQLIRCEAEVGANEDDFSSRIMS